MRLIRELADEIVDTSDMTVHELRQFFMALSRDRSRSVRLSWSETGEVREVELKGADLDDESFDEILRSAAQRLAGSP